MLSKHFPDGIWIDYFKCPECDTAYPYKFTDEELRRQEKALPAGKYTIDMRLRANELRKECRSRIKEL